MRVYQANRIGPADRFNAPMAQIKLGFTRMSELMQLSAIALE